MQINDQISLQKKLVTSFEYQIKMIFAFEGECRNARCVSEARSQSCHIIWRLNVEKFPVHPRHLQTRFEKEKLLIISQAMCPLITQFY